MLAEQLYRDSIIALRSGQWEEATRRLLTLEAHAPGYRSVATVLDALQEEHPLAYWRGRFFFALDFGTGDEAADALKRITRLDPAQPDLPGLRARLDARRAAEIDVEPESPDADTDKSRALKAATFQSPLSGPGIIVSPGPIYNTLNHPRALKSPFFSTAEDIQTSAIPQTQQRDPRKITTKPFNLPEESADPPTFTPERINAVRQHPQQQPIPPALPDTPSAAPPTDLVPTVLIVRRIEIAAILLVFAAALIGLVFTTAYLMEQTDGDPLSLLLGKPTATPSYSAAAAQAENISALITLIDEQLEADPPTAEALDILQQLSHEVGTLINPESEAGQALLAWIDAGATAVTAAQTATTTCENEDLSACAEASRLHSLQTERAAQARRVVCDLTACPKE